MHCFAGGLLDGRGLATKGLIIRHLVLPGGMAGTEAVMKFISSEISKDTYMNVMDQYRPCGEAYDSDQLDRGITRGEFEAAVKLARKAGLKRLD